MMVASFLPRAFRLGFSGLQPVSRKFGLDRGQPIDRWYIERFLDENRAAIFGSVLEVGDDHYIRQFGHHVTEKTVLHAEEGAGRLVGDLSTGEGIPEDAFDCVVLTQVLNVIMDVQSAIACIHSMLREDGVALVTVPGICQISRYDMDRWGDYWRFTTLSARRLFEKHFASDRIEVGSWGNVLVANAYLQGRCVQEVSEEERLFRDEDYQVLITIRAQKG